MFHVNGNDDVHITINSLVENCTMSYCHITIYEANANDGAVHGDISFYRFLHLTGGKEWELK